MSDTPRRGRPRRPSVVYVPVGVPRHNPGLFAGLAAWYTGLAAASAALPCLFAAVVFLLFVFVAVVAVGVCLLSVAACAGAFG